ncbi:iron dicitrate transporter FecR [Novosphingobium indicum]|uniref:Iron dicitrate transporter FecR n=1 Tax=Novosphingobium indicum TaxID=462949 RepID=A0ABQ2JJL5_9SPHN|nr:FecR domain-containing protein [Novosphingobium indicum]GGN47660.1 iron dicitrate transporter FecR [Novosphingobium indicum]
MTSDHEMNSKGSPANEATLEAAVEWFVRQQGDTMKGGDWIAFSDWLGEDESHAAIYDEVVALDGKVERLEATAITPPEAKREPVQRIGWPRLAAIGGMLAAVLVLAVTFWPKPSQLTFETIATAAGETREVMLDPTVRVALNGETRMEIARGPAPVVRLKSGEAAFYIDSPTPSKLRVEAGELTLIDRGTSFDVIQDTFGTRVAVGSGKVVINPDAEAIELAAGQAFLLRSGSATGERRAISADEMAGWRDQRLTYRDAPLPMVAADLSRTLGLRVHIAPGLSQQRFTGVIPTDGEPEEAVSRAAGVLGGTVRRTAKGDWEIEPS